MHILTKCHSSCAIIPGKKRWYKNFPLVPKAVFDQAAKKIATSITDFVTFAHIFIFLVHLSIWWHFDYIFDLKGCLKNTISWMNYSTGIIFIKYWFFKLSLRYFKEKSFRCVWIFSNYVSLALISQNMGQTFYNLLTTVTSFLKNYLNFKDNTAEVLKKFSRGPDVT